VGIKRDKLDAIFSALVRERANQLCESTGRCGSEVQLECCHIVGRRNKAVRWHPLNAMSLCHSQHRFFTENPLNFTAFVESKIGASGLHELKRLAREPAHWTPRQLEGLYKHYVNEYARLADARLSGGRIGRIEFSWPDPMPEAEPRKKAKKAKAKSKFKRKVNGQTVRRDAA
jgi:hypothetical protein